MEMESLRPVIAQILRYTPVPPAPDDLWDSANNGLAWRRREGARLLDEIKERERHDLAAEEIDALRGQLEDVESERDALRDDLKFANDKYDALVKLHNADCR